MYYLILHSHGFLRFQKKSEVVEHVNYILDMTCNTYAEALQALSDYDSHVGYAACYRSLEQLILTAQDAIITYCVRHSDYTDALDNYQSVYDEILLI